MEVTPELYTEGNHQSSMSSLTSGPTVLAEQLLAATHISWYNLMALHHHPSSSLLTLSTWWNICMGKIYQGVENTAKYNSIFSGLLHALSKKFCLRTPKPRSVVFVTVFTSPFNLMENFSIHTILWQETPWAHP